MNWKQAIRALVFLALALVMIISLSYAMRPVDNDAMRMIGFYGEEKNSIDVLLVGSSAVHPFYAAPQAYAEQGFTSYPLSTNMQPPQVMQNLIKEGINTQSPKLICIEARNFRYSQELFLSEETGERHIRLTADKMRYSLNRIDVIRRSGVDHRTDPLFYFIDLYKYHTNWKTAFNDITLDRVLWRGSDPLKGYLFNDNVKAQEPELLPPENATAPIPESTEPYLIELLKYCQTLEMPVLFYFAPYAVTEEQQLMHQYTAQIIREYGFTAIDFNREREEIGLDFATDYYDHAHTNYLGGEKFTRCFAAWLKKQFDLPDHRGEPGYESWEEAWNELVQVRSNQN